MTTEGRLYDVTVYHQVWATSEEEARQQAADDMGLNWSGKHFYRAMEVTETPRSATQEEGR